MMIMERKDRCMATNLKKRGETPRPWTKRVELPIFEGNDPLGWIACIEIYFEVQNVNREE